MQGIEYRRVQALLNQAPDSCKIVREFIPKARKVHDGWSLKEFEIAERVSRLISQEDRAYAEEVFRLCEEGMAVHKKHRKGKIL